MSDQAAAEALNGVQASLTLETLKPRTELKGKITRVELAGARVDVGLGTDGLLHVSDVLCDAPITRLADVLKDGQEVTVYVRRVDPIGKRIGLTMFKPPLFGWDNLEPGLVLHGVKIASVTKFGVFVDISGPKDALLPHELVRFDGKLRQGDSLETVWVTQVEEERNRIGLTMFEPPALPWDRIKRGDVLKGKVTKVDSRAAYIDVGAELEGQIRSTGMGFGQPSDFVEVGEEIEVRVSRVDAQRKILDLALTGMNADDYSLSSAPDETPMSAMEAALKRAQRNQRTASPASSIAASSPSVSKKQAAQAEAIKRTLAHMAAVKEAEAAQAKKDA